MSAIAVVFDPSGAPVSQPRFQAIMSRLAHRGPNGHDSLFAENIALGHWHFWTTPESLGERQPVTLPGHSLQLVFDGRLDNRASLLQLLRIPTVESQTLSDAALVLRAYLAWDERCLEHFLGEFAFALWDARTSTLFCARDPLGDRTLFYTRHGDCIAIASEPWAAAGFYPQTPALNLDALACYFAITLPASGQTHFDGVFELLPAHAIQYGPKGLRVWSYWQPDPAHQIRYKTDDQYAAHFLELLDTSVKVRLRSATPAGVLMSGGFDSTSVASLAARASAPQPLTTVSYIFNELPDCDERVYINAVQEKWNTHSIQIPCDDAWPFKNIDALPRNPNQPEGNIYRLIKERAYPIARAHGLQVLLTGGFGDHLYSGRADALADLLTDAQWARFARELLLLTRERGILSTLQSYDIRRIARRALNALPGGASLRRKPASPPWLTAPARARLQTTRPSLPPPGFELRENLISLWTAYDSSREVFYASSHGIELRHPYRDRRLVEYFLAIPSYLFRSDGIYKSLLARAMRGILPEKIRTRGRPSSLISLYLRGLQNENESIRTRLDSTRATWPHYIDTNWLSRAWDTPLSPENDGPHAVVVWLCLAYEAWQTNYGIIS